MTIITSTRKMTANEQMCYDLGYKSGVFDERRLWEKKARKLIEGVCGGSPPQPDDERAFGFMEALDKILASRDLAWETPSEKRP